MELARNRICRQHGWSIERHWDALSEWEQIEWLADDLRHQQMIEHMLETKLLHPEPNMVSDVAAYVALIMAQW